jgi:ribonuclease HI
MPPLGWFLAQGLIPLGPDSSDDDEGPCELPNGRIVCGPHGLVSCGRCCMDFSFMDEILSDQDDDEDEHDEDEHDEDEHDEDEHDEDEHDEDEHDEDDEDDQCDSDEIEPIIPSGRLFRERRRGTGCVFPSEFTASEGPFSLFHKATRFCGQEVIR